MFAAVRRHRGEERRRVLQQAHRPCARDAQARPARQQDRGAGELAIMTGRITTLRPSPERQAG